MAFIPLRDNHLPPPPNTQSKGRVVSAGTYIASLCTYRYSRSYSSTLLLLQKPTPIWTVNILNTELKTHLVVCDRWPASILIFVCLSELLTAEISSYRSQFMSAFCPDRVKPTLQVKVQRSFYVCMIFSNYSSVGCSCHIFWKCEFILNFDSADTYWI